MRTRPEPSTPPETRARAAELLAQARSESRGGSTTRAWSLATDAAMLGRELGDADIVARAATSVHTPTLVSRDLTAARQALCLEALAMLGPDPSPLRGLVTDHLAAISTAWSEQATPPTAIIAPDEAERRFVELQAAHARALGPRGIPDRLVIAARLVDLGHAAADDEILSWGWLWRADALLQLGLRIEHAEAVAALTAVARRTQAPTWGWRLELIAANVALWEDRRDEAAELAERARESGRRAGAPDADEIHLFFRSALAERSGTGLDDLERDIGAALVGAPHAMQAWRAQVLAHAGRRDEAIAIWRTIAPHLDALPPNAVEWLIASATFAELAVVAQDRAAAEQLRDVLAPLGHLHVAADTTTPYGGPVSLVLGRLETLLGDRTAATTWLTDAERRATLLGARWHAAQAAEELRRTSDPQTVLSPRESEVAELIADGAGNRAIAEALFLSERTVEQHVRSILRKLAVPNRAAVAARVASTRGER